MALSPQIFNLPQRQKLDYGQLGGLVAQGINPQAQILAQVLPTLMAEKFKTQMESERQQNQLKSSLEMLGGFGTKGGQRVKGGSIDMSTGKLTMSFEQPTAKQLLEEAQAQEDYPYYGGGVSGTSNGITTTPPSPSGGGRVPQLILSATAPKTIPSAGSASLLPSQVRAATGEAYKKQLVGEAERKLGAEKQLSGTGQFLNQFGRSYEELRKDFPEIGDVGGVGWASRKAAQVGTAFEYYPETEAFITQLKPLANQMARDIEGGRVTDQDRKIYADSFANALEHPELTNVRLASDALIGLKNKGGNIIPVIEELLASNIPIVKQIGLEAIKQMPEIYEVEE